MENSERKMMNVALVGCGAVVELYYAPALKVLQASGDLKVSTIFDPDTSRVEKLNGFFPDAKRADQLQAMTSSNIDLAIVASPPRFHAEQTIALLHQGVAVLCEKPMAVSLAEAEQMTVAAKQANRILAIGLFRRFFPSSQMVRRVIRNQSLGAVKSFSVSEGGRFEWPAQSASFFKRSGSQGGVLADLGVHVLDLLLWWFGAPEKVEYEDDAMGGLEANCLVTLTFPGNIIGTVRMSRDTPIPNTTVIRCENGWLRGLSNNAEKIEVGFNDSPFVVEGNISVLESGRPGSSVREKARTHHQSFVQQIKNVMAAIRGEEDVFIPGAEGVRSLKLIEECYRSRALMQMPWLGHEERVRAEDLAFRTYGRG